MKTLGTVAVVVLCVVGALAFAAITRLSIDAQDEERRFSEMPTRSVDPSGVDDAIGKGHSWKVRCPTVDGGVDADVFVNVDGGVDRYNFTDIALTNTSTTCVRVGPDDSVDSSHGIPIGTGCAGSPIWPPHTKVARCQSEGAAVVVDVTGGRP